MSLIYIIQCHYIGGYSSARILWLEYKARCAGSGYNFSQGIEIFLIVNAPIESEFPLFSSCITFPFHKNGYSICFGHRVKNDTLERIL